MTKPVQPTPPSTPSAPAVKSKSPIKQSTQKTEAPSHRPVLKPMELKPKPAAQISDQKPSNGSKKFLYIGLSIVIIILGIGSGYGLALAQGGGATKGGAATGYSEPGLEREVGETEITKGTKVGIADESTFRDSAEGMLAKGGIEGTGSHHLVRPGGEDQTLYMTSSVIDLDQFDGRKVKVWGETIDSQTAGWFMEVGKLEVLE